MQWGSQNSYLGISHGLESLPDAGIKKPNSLPRPRFQAYNEYLWLRITGPLYWRLSVSKTHVNELLSGVQKWMESIGMN